jgi:hypothetical protein
VEPVTTNLVVGKTSSRRPNEGDLFAYEVPKGVLHVGRVIRADTPAETAPMPRAYLVYLYDREVVGDAKASIQDLSGSRLLLPPLWVNQALWRKGYFRFLMNQPLTERDLLPRHCFAKWPDQFVDEYGNPVGERTEPCGSWGLASYRFVDDRISEALGIPVVA